MTNDDTVHARLDRLTELFTQRFQQIEDRLKGLDQDTGEIIGLLIALRAGLEEVSGDGNADLAHDLDDDDAVDSRGGPGMFLN